MEASLSVEAAVDRLCQLTGAPAKTQGDEVMTGCPMCRNDTHHLYIKQGNSQSLVIRCVKDETHGPAIIRQFFPPPAGSNGNGKHPSGVLSRYEYHDGEGNLRFFVEVTRYPDGHKESRMGQPGPRGDRWDLHGVTPCLWHLPRLQGLPAGSLVLLPEGEKDVLALERAGFAASTNAGGCGGWKASLVEPLRPFRVTVVADADLPGKRLAERKQVDLIAAGIDCRVLDLGYPIQADHGKDVSDWLREHSAAELATKIQAAWQTPVRQPEPLPERFKLWDLTEVKLIPPPIWQVQDMFERESLVVIFGPSNSGKTFLASSIALGAITGKDWFDRPVMSGSVVYVSAEGGSGFAGRIQAWINEMGDQHPHRFRLLLEPINLFVTSEVIEFCAFLKALPVEQQPRLIVFDTLHRCMASGDENSTADMGVVIRNLNYLQRELSATCIVVHHTGWVGGRMRGNSSLHAAADTVIGVSESEHVHRVCCEKQRNSEAFEPFEFRLEPAADGSCVVRLLAPRFMGTRVQVKKQQNLGQVIEVIAAAEAAVAALDEGARADWQMLRNTLSHVPDGTLRTWVQELLDTKQIAGWNRPAPDFPKRWVYGIEQKSEADCRQ